MFKPLFTAVAALAVLVAGPVVAQAAPALSKTVTVADGATSLTITTDRPMTRKQADALKKEFGGGNTGARGGKAASKKAAPPVISCREGVRYFTDAKGTASFRFNCSYKNVNWGYKIAPNVQAIAVGTVAEAGAIWYRNGKYAGKNASHNEAAWYHFHGTFSNILKGDTVSWYDTYTFRCNRGPNCKAVLKVGGTFVVKK